MNRWSILFLCLISISCQEKPHAIADSRMNDYALYDEKGNFHRFSYYNNSKGIVLFVQGNGCPMVRNSFRDFNSVAEEYSPKGFQFFMINSNLQDDRTSIAKEAEEYQFNLPVLDDSSQLVAQLLDITVTTEVIVLHPTTREILFRGPVNNKFDYETQRSETTDPYLKNALNAILNGKKPISNKEAVRGCKVTLRSQLDLEAAVTYTKDIVPILQNHCVRCHHEGGIAPWNMSDYNTISGWSQMMKQVLLTKRMPPWKADPQIGNFIDNFSLPDSSAYKLFQWIEKGSPYGEGKDVLKEMEIPSQEWKLGTPDTIITLQKEEIPPTGVLPYRYQTIDLKLGQDRWINGIEIQPSNPKIMHHILVSHDGRNGQSPIVNRPPYKWIDNFIALGGLGDQATPFPSQSGVFISKESTLTVQIHYTTTGKSESDETQIGLYYSDDIPKKEFYSLATANINFVIPAMGKDVKIVATDTITKDIMLHTLVPHMHYRGKSIRFIVEFPDGTEQTIVSVPDYNFNWQRLYRLKSPLAIPQGSVIKVEGIYDNTYQNPFNPDPLKQLTFGLQSTDEMLIGFFNYTLQ
jgi:peroxiredoxin